MGCLCDCVCFFFFSAPKRAGAVLIGRDSWSAAIGRPSWKNHPHPRFRFFARPLGLLSPFTASSLFISCCPPRARRPPLSRCVRDGPTQSAPFAWIAPSPSPSRTSPGRSPARATPFWPAARRKEKENETRRNRLISCRPSSWSARRPQSAERSKSKKRARCPSPSTPRMTSGSIHHASVTRT